MLHAVYAVEKFLNDLSRRKGNFHIVFFDDHASLCLTDDGESKEPLIREILIRHLQMNLRDAHPNIKIQVFSSIQSDSFIHYLASTGAYFLMCHDGAAITSSRQSNGESPVDRQCHGRLGFRFMIYEFIRLGYNVALVNGLEFRDSKVITTVLENHGKAPPTTLSRPYMPSRQIDTESSIRLEKLENSDTLIEINERDVLNVLPLCELLQRDSSSSDLIHLQASAFIIHAAVLRLFPLTARRFGPASLSQEDHHFLLLYSQQARGLLQSPTYKRILKARSCCCNIADLLDGKAFSAVSDALKQGLNFNLVEPALLSECHRLTTIGKILCDYDFPTVDQLSSSLSRISLRDSPGWTKTTRPSFSPSVMSFQNAVFDPHLIPIKLTTDNAIEKSLGSSAKVFEEVSHWHNSRKPLDNKAHAATLSSKAHKRNQRFMAEMIAYAGSLTNSIGKSLEPEVIIPLAKDHGPDKKKQSNKGPIVSVQEKAPKSNHKNKKGGQTSGKAAALATAAATQAGKAAKKDKSSLDTWNARCKELEEMEPSARYSKALNFFRGLKTPEVAVVGAEYMLYALNALILDWIGFCKQEKRDLGKSIALIASNQNIVSSTMHSFMPNS